MATDCGPILIVDEDPAFREFVAGLLLRAGFTTVEATTGHEAFATARRENPALVLLEVELPEISGYEVCRELRDTFGEQLPIIFVSGMRTEGLDRVAGLLIGADEYVAKPLQPGELLAKIRRCFSRLGILPRQKEDSSAVDLASPLTPREQEVLSLLTEGLRTKAIAKRLYLSPKTVGTHIQRILNKLGVHSRAEAVAIVHREAQIKDVLHDRVAAQR
jgi:DNA-binding NarL/FixJ family response regulator